MGQHSLVVVASTVVFRLVGSREVARALVQRSVFKLLEIGVGVHSLAPRDERERTFDRVESHMCLGEVASVLILASY